MARRDFAGAVDFTGLRLYAGGDDALVEEVLALFEEQAVAWLRMLEGEGFRDAAHTLKGAALGLHAADLAAACARAEDEAHASPPAREVLAARVRDEVDRVRGDIAAWRHELLLQGLRAPGGR